MIIEHPTILEVRHHDSFLSLFHFIIVVLDRKVDVHIFRAYRLVCSDFLFPVVSSSFLLKSEVRSHIWIFGHIFWAKQFLFFSLIHFNLTMLYSMIMRVAFIDIKILPVWLSFFVVTLIVLVHSKILNLNYKTIS